MRVAAGFLGILIAVGALYILYQAQSAPGGTGPASPQEQIDVTAIRAALLAIGQAERLYVNVHGAYGTLEQLQADGPATLGSSQRGYTFQVDPRAAQGFTAIAIPVDAEKSGWPTLVIDETMQISMR
jgi:hypothetical protein